MGHDGRMAWDTSRMLDCRLMEDCAGLWVRVVLRDWQSLTLDTARILDGDYGQGQSGSNARLPGLRGGRSMGQGGASARAPHRSSPQKKLYFW